MEIKLPSSGIVVRAKVNYASSLEPGPDLADVEINGTTFTMRANDLVRLSEFLLKAARKLGY